MSKTSLILLAILIVGVNNQSFSVSLTYPLSLTADQLAINYIMTHYSNTYHLVCFDSPLVRKYSYDFTTYENITAP